MNIVVISASMRANSQSLKVSHYLAQEVNRQERDAGVLDLYELGLPPYDDSGQEGPAITTMRKQLDDADGCVFVSPEWDGMMSYGLMNMLHFIGKELAHKPVMLVGVSAGRGGSYPVAQMKMIGQKNRHYVIIPEALVVSGVNDVFNDNSMDENANDLYLKKRAQYAISILLSYADALRNLRATAPINFKDFGNGV